VDRGERQRNGRCDCLCDVNSHGKIVGQIAAGINLRDGYDNDLFGGRTNGLANIVLHLIDRNLARRHSLDLAGSEIVGNECVQVFQRLNPFFRRLTGIEFTDQPNDGLRNCIVRPSLEPRRVRLSVAAAAVNAA